MIKHQDRNKEDFGGVHLIGCNLDIGDYFFLWLL